MAENNNKPVKRGKTETPITANPIKATKNEMSERITKLKYVYDLPKIDLDSDQEVEDRVNLYFQYCGDVGLKPTVEGLAMAIGVSRATIWDWEVGRSRAGLTNTRSDIIKKAKDFIAILMSDMALDNKIFPATWIFYAKNYFGMKDVQDIQITPNSALGDEMTSEEIAKSIAQDPDGDLDIIDLD